MVSLSRSLIDKSFRITHCLAIIFALTLAIVPTSLHARDAESIKLNQLRFKEKMWDAQVLRIFIEGPKYLSKDLEFTLPSPPKNNSPAARNELATLLKYQATKRDKTTVELIKAEAQSGDFVKIFLNNKAIAESLANASYNILTLANDECQFFVVKYKKRFARPRPSALIAALKSAKKMSGNLKLVVPNPGHAAYPSGHATQSMLMAKILGIIDPVNLAKYETYAKAVATRREIAGVHYPSDSKAGQILAKALLSELLKNNEFLSKLDRAKRRFKTTKN